MSFMGILDLPKLFLCVGIMKEFQCKGSFNLPVGFCDVQEGDCCDVQSIVL